MTSLLELCSKKMLQRLSRSRSSAFSLNRTALFSTSLLIDDAHKQFKENVAQFAQEHIAPHAENIDKTDNFPKDVNLWKLMGDFNLHGLTAPVKYGGLDMGYMYQCMAIEEITRASASVGVSYGVHTNVCINQLLISGVHVGALSISEPNAGSDAVGMRTKADRVDGGYVLNGNKMWCTNGFMADTIVVYAKTNPAAGSKGITAFIIEKGSPGFTVSQKLNKLGMRGSGTCELVFENCFVPTENVVGEEGKGVYIMMSGLDIERTVLAAGPVGIMQACLDIVLSYVAQTKFQLMQDKIVDNIYASLQSSRAFLYSVARDCDNGKINPKDSASVILFAAERATQAASQAMQCLGSNGYTNEHTIGRLLRDAKMYEIGAGTSEIRRMIIGRELLKQQ